MAAEAKVRHSHNRRGKTGRRRRREEEEEEEEEEERKLTGELRSPPSPSAPDTEEQNRRTETQKQREGERRVTWTVRRGGIPRGTVTWRPSVPRWPPP
jgi:hypothetical protein